MRWGCTHHCEGRHTSTNKILEHLGGHQLKGRGKESLCNTSVWVVHSGFLSETEEKVGTHDLSQGTRVTIIPWQDGIPLLWFPSPAPTNWKTSDSNSGCPAVYLTMLPQDLHSHQSQGTSEKLDPRGAFKDVMTNMVDPGAGHGACEIHG